MSHAEETASKGARLSRADCAALDAKDPLASLRQRFEIPPGTIYLDGNSLGPVVRGVRERLAEVAAHEWGRDLISSWNRHGWIGKPQALGARIAPLIGAAPGQVLVADSVSVNLFKVLAAALAADPARNVILSTEDNFPTDLYIADGLARLSGAELCVVPRGRLVRSLDRSVAVLLATQVDFRTGALLDMQRLTRLAHDQGALCAWDLSHSAGALPLALDAWQVDFAVGCTYKFLNGGPGAPAFVYVAERHHTLTQPLAGWMGHAAPFLFETGYRPAPGIDRYASGTPPILALAAVEAALAVFEDVAVTDLAAKSASLGSTFQILVAGEPALDALVLRSPVAPAARGSQICYAHPEGYAVAQALIARGVICDFREPDIVRFGLAPLYVSHADIFDAVEHLTAVVAGREYLRPAYRERQQVT